MGKLSQTDEAIVILKCLKVLQLIYRENFSKSMACEKAGLSVYLFEDYLAKHDDSLEQLQATYVEAERVQLADLQAAHHAILGKLIQRVGENDKPLPPETLMMIDNHLQKQIHIITEKLNIEEGLEAHEYALNGPKLRQENSQMERSEITFRATGDGGVAVTLPLPPHIIDASFTPSSSDSDQPSSLLPESTEEEPER
jgi:hypothetical protein